MVQVELETMAALMVAAAAVVLGTQVEQVEQRPDQARLDHLVGQGQVDYLS